MHYYMYIYKWRNFINFAKVDAYLSSCCVRECYTTYYTVVFDELLQFWYMSQIMNRCAWMHHNYIEVKCSLKKKLLSLLESTTLKWMGFHCWLFTCTDIMLQFFFYLWRFQYKRNLTQQLQKLAHIVSVFQEQVMQGQTGVVVNISTAELKGKVHTIPTFMSQN